MQQRLGLTHGDPSVRNERALHAVARGVVPEHVLRAVAPACFRVALGQQLELVAVVGEQANPTQLFGPFRGLLLLVVVAVLGGGHAPLLLDELLRFFFLPSDGVCRALMPSERLLSTLLKGAEIADVVL